MFYHHYQKKGNAPEHIAITIFKNKYLLIIYLIFMVKKGRNYFNGALSFFFKSMY